MTYTLQQAQSNLAQLLSEAAQGREVVIERKGQPSVRIAVSEVSESAHPAGERVFGQYRGLIEFDDSAFDPLTDEELVEHGFGFMLDKKLVSEEEQDKKAG